jgi:beta-galactosidase
MSWNGIVGKIELRATSAGVWIDDAQVYPDVATAQCAGARAHRECGRARRQRHADRQRQGLPGQLERGGRQAEITVQYPRRRQTWDEFHPALHKMPLSLEGR